MLYHLLFIIILVFAIQEIKSKVVNVQKFIVVYYAMTLMITFKYAQGNDYFNYGYIYKQVATIGDEDFLLLFLQSDFGYCIINYIFYKLGMSYEVFSGLFSFLTMCLFYRFFSRQCHKSQIPLLIFYSSCFLPYPYNAVRQGFALACVVGLLYPLLLKKKYVSYYIVSLFVISIHLSAIVCWLIPFVLKFKISNTKLFLIFIMLSLIMLADVNTFSFLPIGDSLSERASYYLSESTANKYFAKLIRIIVILPVFLIPQNVYSKNKELLVSRNLLFLGFAFYSILSYSELTSSRISAYFRVFEGYFLYLLLFRTSLKKINIQLFGCFAILSYVLLVKDINSFIQLVGYSNCNVFTYPYINVFDDMETVSYYRTVPSNFH